MLFRIQTSDTVMEKSLYDFWVISNAGNFFTSTATISLVCEYEYIIMLSPPELCCLVKIASERRYEADDRLTDTVSTELSLLRCLLS
jgi:hypothetical protein